MPCQDITETLLLRLDANEQVVEYSLHKQSCGAAVMGRGLIKQWVKNKTAAEVLALSPATLLEQAGPDQDSSSEYLRLKHLFAVQAMLSVYAGDAADDLCELLEITHSPEGVELGGLIKIDAMTEQIRSCGLCDNCG